MWVKEGISGCKAKEVVNFSQRVINSAAFVVGSVI
jgi:hypothetical protein